MTLIPRDNVVMNAGWLVFWRHRIDDGIYATCGSLLRSAEGTRSRFVGHSPGVDVEWRVTRQLSLTGNASLFTAGPFIEESGPAQHHEVSRRLGDLSLLIRHLNTMG